MTILKVRHQTLYQYRKPVTLGDHRLMLRPRDSHDLRLISSDLTCEPAASLTWSHDVFGNSLASATFAKPSQTLSITSHIVVEQCAPAWPVFAIAAFALTYPFAYSADERTDLGALLTPQYENTDGRLAAWANAFVMRQHTDTLSLLKDINTGLSANISYQSRDDERTQAPVETLARGWGTCRDYAVLFVEAVRILGFGARIVSGYLYDPDATLTGQQDGGSTHAWAEVYLPGAGWIAFDPTNRALGSANLIRIAVARNIEQTSPISGSFVGSSEDFLGLKVAVSVTKA
ncbi:MAG: transglutaminase family protein [Burkholderiales bacterium]|nr:MAG: transglutaminase family protein [Burkholderiales bacterium]